MVYQNLNLLKPANVAAGLLASTGLAARAVADLESGEHHWAGTERGPKVQMQQSRFGRGVFATTAISKGEVVLEFDGPIYKARDALDLPAMAVNHAIQFAEN